MAGELPAKQHVLELGACADVVNDQEAGGLRRLLVHDDSDVRHATAEEIHATEIRLSESKALIGLSGGIDSALTAAIAVDALGKENVTGIAMPSQYSSEHSIKDARELACKLGIRFEVVPIGPVFDGYLKALAPLFAGTPFGLAEENLQPRIRGTLLMALSNKFGALVLTTGNKSEMSTGYCTLYGDMVGALAVIGDVMKTRVYALSRYVNRVKEVIPWATIEKPPSAELRPNQLDTDSLPPYEILDDILECLIEKEMSFGSQPE